MEKLDDEKEMIEKYKREISKFSRLSYNRGLIAAKGRNLSIRIPGKEHVLRG